MSKRAAGWLAWSLVLLVIAFYIATLLISASLPPEKLGKHGPIWPISASDLAMLSYAVIGAFIAIKRPENAIGWMFLAIGFASMAWGLACAYVSYIVPVASASSYIPPLWLWLALVMWIIPYTLLPLLLLLFPDGHLPSPRWKPAVWLLFAAILVGLVSSGATVEAGSFSIQAPSLAERLGFRSLADPLQSIFGLSILIFFGAGVLAIIVRFRHARSAERQQIKWLIYAGAVFLLIYTAEMVIFFSGAAQVLDPSALVPADLFWGIPSALAFIFIPIATAIAILRYRLYDIDFLISRTLIYTILTACLGLIYFAGVFLLQQAFHFVTGDTSPFAIIISTLAIAVLFTPLRKRLQDFIDRRFYRRKYDAARTLEVFSAVIREQVELDKVSSLLVSLVAEAMQPESVSLWLVPSFGSRDQGKL